MKKISIQEIVRITNAVIRPTEHDYIDRVVIDSRDVKKYPDKNVLFVALEGEHVDGHNFVLDALNSGASYACVNKTYPEIKHEKRLFRVDDTLKALDELGKYYLNQFNLPKIAITGSVGKTITKEYIANVLSQKLNVHKSEGNLNTVIGLPITIFDMNDQHEVSVLELGTNHFGEIKRLTELVQPDIAVITTIGASHLEFLHDLDGVFREKFDLFKCSQEKTLKIFCSSIKYLEKYKSQKNYISYGFDEDDDYFVEDIHIENGVYHFLVNNEHFYIANDVFHNVINAIPAIILGFKFKLAYDQIQNGLLMSPEVGLRMEFFKNENKDWLIIADCYNANPVSMASALAYLENLPHHHKYVIIGDMLELGEKSEQYHRDIGILIREMDVLDSYAVGPMAKYYTCKHHYDTGEQLLEELAEDEFPTDTAVLVKASRGIALEKIVERLKS